jgi:hypothetical protein
MKTFKIILAVFGFLAQDGKANWGGIGAWFFASLFIIGGCITDEPYAIGWGVIMIVFFIGMNLVMYLKNRDEWNKDFEGL